MNETLMRVLQVLLGIVAVSLTVLVVLQDNRGGGLAGVLAGYGGESAFGTETVSQVKKLTAYLGVLFFVILLVVALLNEPGGIGVITEQTEQAVREQQPATVPGASTPTAPAPQAPAPATPAPGSAE